MENNRYVQILQGALRTAQDPAQRLSKALDAYKQIDTRLARLKNQPDQKDSALRNLFVTNLVNSDFVAAGSGIRDHAKYSSVSSFYELDKSTFLSLVKDRREWSYLLESIGLMTWPVSKVLLKEILKDKDLIEQEKDDDSCSFSVALAMAGILSARLSPKFPADEEADDTKVLIDLIETVEEAIKKALQKKPKEKEASTSRNLVFSLLLFHLAACPSASQQMPIKFGAGNVSSTDLAEFYLNAPPDSGSPFPSAIPVKILDKIVHLFETSSQSLDVGTWCELVDLDFAPGSPWQSDYLDFWADASGAERPANVQAYIAHLAFLVQAVIPEQDNFADFKTRIDSLAKEFCKEDELGLADKPLAVVASEGGECFVPWMRKAYAKHLLTTRWDETVSSADTMLALTELKREAVPYIQNILKTALSTYGNDPLKLLFFYVLNECPLKEIEKIFDKVIAQGSFQGILKCSRFEGDLKVFLNQIYKKSDSSESEEPSEAAFNKKDLLCLAIQSPQELVNCLLDEAISSGQKGSNSSAAVILEILTILEKIVLRKTEGEFHIIHEIVSRYTVLTDPGALSRLATFVADLSERLSSIDPKFGLNISSVLIQLSLKHPDKPELIQIFPRVITRQVYAESSERNFLLHLRSLIYLVDQAGQVPAVRLDDQERLIRLLIQLVGDNALAKDFVVQFLRTKSLDWFFRPRSEAVTLTQVVNSSKDEAAIKEDEVFDFQGQADEGEKIMLIHLAAKEILPGQWGKLLRILARCSALPLLCSAMSLFSVARNQEDAAAAAPAPGEDSEVEAKQVIGCFSNALGDYIREEDPELKQCLLIAERLTMLSNSLTHSSAVIETVLCQLMNLIMKEKILPLTDENFKETTTKELMALILSLPDHCDMKNLMFQKIKLILEY